MKINNRNVALDLVRVIACLLVMVQHSSEFYYIGDQGALVLDSSVYSIGWLNSLSRTCVPLFVMLSGYFLLPMKGGTGAFFKKRFSRIIGPFLFWCVAFAFYFIFYRGDTMADFLTNVAHIPVNFGTEVGHLWYIYMLIGLYLLIPVLSPWVAQCSKKELQTYLGLWLLSTCLPYIHLVWPEVLGECYWNISPTLYYFTGFVGYLLLGSYAKKYGPASIPAAVTMLFLGYLVSVLVFCSRIATVDTAEAVELSWQFCVINVVMMVWGLFSLLVRINHVPAVLAKVIVDISIGSYAMYLGHIMLLNFYHQIFGGRTGNVLFEIPVIAICTFITVYFVVRLLRKLPKAKYWLGTND
ncbi:acyltransferase [Hoylesella buccalis]|uniref:Membrane protein n=1 Tax=Hoylesella buccalis DNF00853 TaxID=1401074 RepID=A0A095ZJX1_9BACT|nr:acyltransferase family protein [Hoylesella buccalis]KGF34998.1 membrane protein [Hoylesella buccalis DNF00853]